MIELGITTFAEVDEKTQPIDYDGRILRVIEEIKCAEEAGLDYYGVGEHHRKDFAVSAPALVLAAASTMTKRIKLGSAVTVLSSDDPVRIYQQAATLAALSNGRAELCVGRGSFVESFPLFGQDLADYDGLFEEKLRMLLKCREEEKVTHQGKHRPSIANLGVYPRTKHDIPISIAVGGTRESVLRAGRLGLPLFLAIIGGESRRFKALIELYDREFLKHGHPKSKRFVSVHSHGFIGEDSTKTKADYFPSIEKVMTKIGAERGWGPYTKEVYRHALSLEGALYVGDAKEVAEKVNHTLSFLAIDRFVLHVPVGPMPHEAVLKTIKLFGTEVKKLLEEANHE